MSRPSRCIPLLLAALVACRAEESDDVEAMLDAIGYTAAGEVAAHESSGVITHDPDKAWPGLNLIVAAHAPEALLVDMDGEVVHRWRADFEDLFPKQAAILYASRGKAAPKIGFFRRAQLMPDGGLTVIFGGHAIARLTRDSGEVWVHHGRIHHDLALGPDGTLITLSRRPRRVHSEDGVAHLADDQVVVMDADSGRILKRVSISRALEASEPEVRAPWDGVRHQVDDALHTNSVFPLTEPLPDHPGFCAGCVLTSMRELDTIGVLDLDARAFTWTATGAWDAQHDPQVVGLGRILLYDNKGPLLRRSRILEVDVSGEDMETVWSWSGFYSALAGSVQRLPNGNTLVTETDGGRALEVDRYGDVVWEWRNPWEVDGRAARLYEVVRISEEQWNR